MQFLLKSPRWPVSSQPMQIKDYFAILELAPSASYMEIKKAYRKLALQLHPDKTGNDPYAAARFAEIKEAYEVLTDPAKKEYYLQQRWYNQSIGRRKTQDIITPVNLLKQSIELERYVSRLDSFRMDREGLLQYMLDLYNEETMEKLKSFDEPDTKKAILRAVITAMKPLNAEQAGLLITRLKKGIPPDLHMEQQLHDTLRQTRKNDRQEKWGFLLPLILTVLICLLMYLAVG